MTEIAVVFKRAPQHLFQRNQTLELGQNALVIRVQPDEGVTIRFGSKVPGAANEVRDVTMDFGYGHAFTESSPEAYERLILDVLLGDPPLFPRHEEVELSWKILDPIEQYWSAEDHSTPVRGVPRLPMSFWPVTAALRASMIVDLPDTTVSKIARSLVSVREEGGAVALGRVLTLVIVTTHGLQEEAIEAANDACASTLRVIVLIADPEGDATLDAQIRVGGDVARAKVIVLRAHGEAASNQEGSSRARSCPTRPSWPGGPTFPGRPRGIRHRSHGAAEDHGCLHEAVCERPAVAAGASYAPGDTDLAWTRLTHWAEMQLVAVLDQPPYEPVTAVEVVGVGVRPRRSSPRGCA